MLIEGLTIRGGSAEGGGRIINYGNLTLQHCVVTENTANNSGGGGIRSTAGALTGRQRALFSEHSRASLSWNPDLRLWPRALAFSPDGSLLASSHKPNVVRIWKVPRLAAARHAVPWMAKRAADAPPTPRPPHLSRWTWVRPSRTSDPRS